MYKKFQNFYLETQKFGSYSKVPIVIKQTPSLGLAILQCSNYGLETTRPPDFLFAAVLG